MSRSRSIMLAFTLVAICALSVDAEPIRYEGHTGSVGNVALSADGKLAVSSDASFVVRVWNTADATEIRKFQVFPPDTDYGYISALAISPDGKVIATAAWRQPVCFWDSETGERHEENLPVNQAPYSLAFSPDGSKLAVGEYAKVKIWDLVSRRVLHDFRFDQNQIGQAWQVVFSPDGTRLAAALLDYGGSFTPRAPKVRVWNVATGEEMFSAWPDKSVVAVAFSRDGKLAAAGDRLIEVWDINTQQSLQRIAGNDHVILCLTFTPDGSNVVTGRNSPRITLWDISTGEESGTINGHKDQVRYVGFSHDGRIFASAGNDSAVSIWSCIDGYPGAQRKSHVHKEP